MGGILTVLSTLLPTQTMIQRVDYRLRIRGWVPAFAGKTEDRKHAPLKRPRVPQPLQQPLPRGREWAVHGGEDELVEEVTG